MGINLNDAEYILGMWMMTIDRGKPTGSGRITSSDGTLRSYRGLNVMLVVYRENGQSEGDWTIVTEFRYHVDDKVFDSDDVKHFRRVKKEGKNIPPDKMLVEVSALVGSLCLAIEADPKEVQPFIVQGDGEKFFDMVKDNPPEFIHGYRANADTNIEDIDWAEVEEQRRLREMGSITRSKDRIAEAMKRTIRKIEGRE